MNLDIRIPIGGMFSVIGVLLVVYGLVTTGSEIYQRSLGMNVNIIWGVVLLGFGGLMLFFGLRSKPSQPGSDLKRVPPEG